MMEAKSSETFSEKNIVINFCRASIVVFRPDTVRDAAITKTEPQRLFSNVF